MKKVSIFLFSLLIFLHTSILAYSTDPKEFVNELVNDAINKLADKNLNKDQKAAFIEKIASEHVDIDAFPNSCFSGYKRHFLH